MSYDISSLLLQVSENVMKNNWISQPGNHLQKIWSEHEILVSTNIHHLIIPSYHELNLLSEKYSGFAISKCKEPIYFQGISNQLSFHFFQVLMLRNLSTWSHFYLLLFLGGVRYTCYITIKKAHFDVSTYIFFLGSLLQIPTYTYNHCTEAVEMFLTLMYS